MRFSGPIAAAHDMALRLPFARAACGAERTRIVTHTVVFLDRDSLKAKVRRPAQAVRYVEHARTAPDEIVARLADASVAITNKVPLRAPTLEQLPRLKMIAVAATGYDVVDVDTAARTASPSPTSATTPCTPCPSTPSR